MRNRGFTLIELALILVVVGLVSLASFQIDGRLGDSDKVTATNQKLDRIQKALQVYVVQHGCLPCPALGTLTVSSASDGKADASGAFYVAGATFCAPAACITANAVVPWVDIGLSEPRRHHGCLG